MLNPGKAAHPIPFPSANAVKTSPLPFFSPAHVHFCRTSSHAQASRFKACINPARLRMCIFVMRLRMHKHRDSKPVSILLVLRMCIFVMRPRARQHRFKQALLSSLPCTSTARTPASFQASLALLITLHVNQHCFKQSLALLIALHVNCAHANIVSSKPSSPHRLARQLRARQHCFKQSLALLIALHVNCAHAIIVSSKALHSSSPCTSTARTQASCKKQALLSSSPCTSTARTQA